MLTLSNLSALSLTPAQSGRREPTTSALCFSLATAEQRINTTLRPSQLLAHTRSRTLRFCARPRHWHRSAAQSRLRSHESAPAEQGGHQRTSPARALARRLLCDRRRDTPGVPSALDTASNTMAQKLTADEQRLLRLYGKLPNKKDLLQNKLKVRLPFPAASPFYRSLANTCPPPGTQVL